MVDLLRQQPFSHQLGPFPFEGVLCINLERGEAESEGGSLCLYCRDNLQANTYNERFVLLTNMPVRYVTEVV